MIEGLGWTTAVIAVLVTIILMHDRGYRPGLRTAWFVFSLAVPAWLFVNFRSLRIEPVATIAITGLAWGLLRPFHGLRTRWVVSDLLLVGILLSCFLSDLVARTLIPGTVLDAVRMWVLPYALGRTLFVDTNDYRHPLSLISMLAIGLALLAVLEAVAQTNILAQLTGMRWELLDRSEGFRWGLKRAHVTRNHPIYFGLLMSLTLPWLLLAFREAHVGRGPTWWMLAPMAGVVAGFLSIARSAHLALLLVLGSDLFFRRPNYRFPMLLLAAFITLGVGVYWTETLDLLGRFIGEASVGSDRVQIYGINYDYTGTRHRELLVLAYEEAAEEAGWLGYGSNLRDMPVDPYMDRRFASIDHHYLLHYLRFGTLGLITFFLFAGSAAFNLLRVAWSSRTLEADLAGGLFGAFVAVLIMLRGLAMMEDFGATWLFVAGLGASMRAKMLLGPSRSVPTNTEHPKMW